MDTAIYVCVLISLSVETHDATPVPPVLIQYCGICNLLVTPFSDREELGSPSPESVYLLDQCSWV